MFYCRLTLTQEEAEILDKVEVRTEWEILSKKAVSKPERVRRILADVLVEKDGGRSG